MKMIITALLTLSSIPSFAESLCGQTWTSDNRFYIDGKDGVTDIEVLVPAHASKYVTKHFKESIAQGCLSGKSLRVGGKVVFVAVGIN